MEMMDKLRMAMGSIFLVLTLALTVSGCSGSSPKMMVVSETAAVATPATDKAAVVFMRPYSLGFAVQATLFDITDGSNNFIGILSARKKIAYQSPAGVRRFMVIGETAKFIEIETIAGRTHYASVEPQLGAWKARFSVEPVSPDSSSFASDLASCTWVVNTPESASWAVENAASINEKKLTYLPGWLKSQGNPAR